MMDFDFVEVGEFALRDPSDPARYCEPVPLFMRSADYVRSGGAELSKVCARSLAAAFRAAEDRGETR